MRKAVLTVMVLPGKNPSPIRATTNEKREPAIKIELMILAA